MNHGTESGYSGLSVAGENTWCFHTDYSFDRVLDFESLFDDRPPDLPVTALCQYRLSRFDGECRVRIELPGAAAVDPEPELE